MVKRKAYSKIKWIFYHELLITTNLSVPFLEFTYFNNFDIFKGIGVSDIIFILSVEHVPAIPYKSWFLSHTHALVKEENSR